MQAQRANDDKIASTSNEPVAINGIGSSKDVNQKFTELILEEARKRPDLNILTNHAKITTLKNDKIFENALLFYSELFQLCD